MRSKYCFRPEDLSSAVFWFDNVYLRTTTEHPEDLFTLYVMRVQKRKWRTFGVFSFCWMVRGSNNFIQRICGRLGVYISHHISPDTLFLAVIFLLFVWDMCLSFVRKMPLLTLTARNQFLTKTINLQFTSLHGTSSLSRVPLLPYKVTYGNSITEETNASLEDFGVLFFPGNMGSSFCIRINFVVNLCSFHARVRRFRHLSVFPSFVWSRGAQKRDKE